MPAAAARLASPSTREWWPVGLQRDRVDPLADPQLVLGDGLVAGHPDEGRGQAQPGLRSGATSRTALVRDSAAATTRRGG